MRGTVDECIDECMKGKKDGLDCHSFVYYNYKLRSPECYLREGKEGVDGAILHRNVLGVDYYEKNCGEPKE